jgi:hypothetical protein
MSGSNSFTARKTAWDITFASFNMGTTNKVDPSKLKFITEPIWRGTTGGPKNELGDFIIGLTGGISADIMDVTLAAFEAAAPWWSSGSVMMVPETINTDMYSYAALLTLHPHDEADTNQDLNFLNAVAMTPPGTPARDGSKNDVWTVEFKIYPSRTYVLEGKLVYGYVGGTAPTW